MRDTATSTVAEAEVAWQGSDGAGRRSSAVQTARLLFRGADKSSLSDPAVLTQE